MKSVNKNYNEAQQTLKNIFENLTISDHRLKKLETQRVSEVLNDIS